MTRTKNLLSPEKTGGSKLSSSWFKSWFQYRSCGHIGMVATWHSEGSGFESRLGVFIMNVNLNTNIIPIYVLAFCKHKYEMCPCISRNARPNNNQLCTYYKCVHYLLKNIYNTCEYYLQYLLYLIYQEYANSLTNTSLQHLGPRCINVVKNLRNYKYLGLKCYLV